MVMYPNNRGLTFGMPMTGRPIPPDVMFAFHSMAMPMAYEVGTARVVGKPVDEARNAIADAAIANESKYIFFWDEDVACPPQTIPELIYKAEHNPDAAVISGVYCLKREPAEPLVFKEIGSGPYWKWRVGEFFEAAGCGMGCTLIRVEALADIKRPWFKTLVDYSAMMDGICGMKLYTEDLWFCEKVRDTRKWKIYIDGSILCGHYDMTSCKRYDLPTDSYPVQHLTAPKGSKKILHIGVTPGLQNGDEGKIVTADCDESAKPDYRCDLHRLPFDHNTFDVVTSPVLENFASSETEELLTEWIRVLKPDGEFRIVVGNLKEVARQIADGKLDPEALYTGKRKTAFTLESLKAALDKLPLKEIEKATRTDPAHLALKARKA